MIGMVVSKGKCKEKNNKTIQPRLGSQGRLTWESTISAQIWRMKTDKEQKMLVFQAEDTLYMRPRSRERRIWKNGMMS